MTTRAASRWRPVILLTLFCSLMLCICSSLGAFTADEAQQWREQNVDFDWKQEDGSKVHIVGRGAEDAAGNLYFVGTKTYPDSKGQFVDDQNMFVARINADDSIGWTREFGTNETDGGNFVTVLSEAKGSSFVPYLYVVGWTWGFMDDGAHALNGFGQFGGRDVVLLKLALDTGRKIWARQFGSTINDMGYGVQRDGGFDSLLLTGASSSDQVDGVIEVNFDAETEPRQKPLSLYETQLMDARARSGISPLSQYQFAASISRQGDVLDFTMDGGVTLARRRQRIAENSSLVGEYAVTLNRRPLEAVTVTATIVCLPHPENASLLIQELAFVKTNTTQRMLHFTPDNWNREQLVRVAPVDDSIAKGTHYAVITHSVSSRDPNFNGNGVPFIYGNNVTMQIDDNDVPGVQLSRRHLFVGEGGVNDTYEIVLRSQPWHPVTVTIFSLHSAQVVATPSVLTFTQAKWNIPQVVTVVAVDDNVSESEFGGLHFGGRLMHLSESKDRRYHTRRPVCFDVARCDPEDPSICLSDDSSAATVRICDLLTPQCCGRLGNGACIANVGAIGDFPQTRFGAPPLLDDNPDESELRALSFHEIKLVLEDQAGDMARVIASRIASETGNSTIPLLYPFTIPPARLRGFVLSFLGLLNLGQAREIHRSFFLSLQSVCSGLDRIASHQWTSGVWPEGIFPQVLNATLKMFGGSVNVRHLWQCGMASFRPGSSSINVSIWDNDAGVTLSTRSLTVGENGLAAGGYSIVLNSPPAENGLSRLKRSFCSLPGTDDCGLWSNYSSLVESIYDVRQEPPLLNVSIAIIGNAHVAVSPSVVTFTTANWFLPQWVVVRATDDSVAQGSEALNTIITHRVQSSSLGYSNDLTAFWFSDSSPRMSSLFPRWQNASEAKSLPYNFMPSIIHSSQHKQINVRVVDDDVAGVIVSAPQPQDQIKTRESDDTEDNWVGDSVKSIAFGDISLAKSESSTSTSLGGGATLESVLVFETNATTFMKFHLPERHSGDTDVSFAFAKLRVYETPFKVINASADGAGSSASASSSAFGTSYHLRITVVDNAWTRAHLSNGMVDPSPVAFMGDEHSIEVTASMTKQRFAAIDVTPLIKRVHPTRLPVVSLRIQVLSSIRPGESGGSATDVTTHLCSSLFERPLRPSLVFGYVFPNRLLGGSARQSSSVKDASAAVSGLRAADSASETEVETNPWWEVSLSRLVRLGSLAIFLPQTNDDATTFSRVVMIIASSITMDSTPLTLDEATKHGCPDACPKVVRQPLRKALTITRLDAGVRTLRIYQEGVGSLRLRQVEAYDPHVVLTPTANGQGLRSRLKMDWNGALHSDSWRLLQSIRQSDDENMALAMLTRQSSTDPAQAVSSLAVDGQKRRYWDPFVWMDASSDDPSSTIAGSTRTKVEDDPWWEVDLGEATPISQVEVFPYIGDRGRGFCKSASANTTLPTWAGDLYAYSKTDERLQLQDPFVQTFDIILSDTPLSTSGVLVVANKTVTFSCAGGIASTVWTSVFTKARFVTVRRPGANVVLMLNEVVVTRWNPATTPQYMLVSLRGNGEAPLALSSIQLFAPIDQNNTYAVPLVYSIHSVSSQRASSGTGSASALLSASTSDCYIAASAAYREWVVLKLETPSRVGLIDVQASVDKCGSGVSPILGISVSVRGASLDGVRSAEADARLTASTPPDACILAASAQLVSTSALSSECESFMCDDVSCRAIRTTADGVVFGDFNDVVLLGVPSFAPTSRLPVIQHDTRAMLLRDNPVQLWMFESALTTQISHTRISTPFEIATSLAYKALDIDDAIEQSFFSNAVAVQPAMSAFSIEFWLSLSSLASSAVLVDVVTPPSAVVADLSITAQAPRGVFTVRDPNSGGSCAAKLASSSIVFDTIGRWYHVVASYDPKNARIILSVRFATDDYTVLGYSSNVTCNLPLLSSADKALRFGASVAPSNPGFVGRIANVAWYVDVLSSRQMRDHFHDFLTVGTLGPLHNSYGMRLASKPATPVRIDVNAESACYYFSLCNVSALPSAVVFTPEEWNVTKYVNVLATDDQLYESLHRTTIVHEASSLPSYTKQALVTTEDLTGVDAQNWIEYKASVARYDRAAVYNRNNSDFIDELHAQLNEIHLNWSTQSVSTSLSESHAYAKPLPIRDVAIEIEDLTIPGIQFSTSSLVVTESGKGNDYQILLLSEPTSDVVILLDAQSDCYRECFANPQCPSQAATDDLSCGGGSSSTKLCNITVSPDVLVFTSTNWSYPQTVRVVAVDDFLDEADVHLTTIKATSQSADPVYDALFLPDIVVAVEDNDDTAIRYSTLSVSLSESDPAGSQYDLALQTEPWANVTIAMSNEADGLCYRPCGYPFDEADCGLPRQQSVSTVLLATDSSREIHEISLLLPRPRVMEVQRIVTYSDHVDHIYSVQVTGGFAPEVQVIEFVFNSAFKTRFKTAAAITSPNAMYIKSLKITAPGKSAQGYSIDGFSTAEKVAAAVNAALFGRNTKESVVRVTRQLQYEESVLRWQVTFLRFLSDDLSFPLLMVSPDSPFEGTLSVQRVTGVVMPSGSLRLAYGSGGTNFASVPAPGTASDVEAALRDLDIVYSVITSRRAVSSSNDYGLIYGITFVGVESYEELLASTEELVPAVDALSTAIRAQVTEQQSPVRIGGSFIIRYDSPYVNVSAGENTTLPVRETRAIPWNASEGEVASHLAGLFGLGQVNVVRRQLSPEGAMDWTVAFTGNNGNLSLLDVESVNLTGKGVTVQALPDVDGVSLGGFFTVEMGGPFVKTHPLTRRVYVVEVDKRNTTALAFNISDTDLETALVSLGVTERTKVTREGVDCDSFDVCEGFVWTISYVNSAGNVPPIRVFGANETITGAGATLESRTVANGTYLGGYFSLVLELNDTDANTIRTARTWNLPVNVSSAGMDEALEAIRWVRSNREAEYDPETGLSRGVLFDKGVRVERKGPFLDGGHLWRLAWAIEDYVRFQDLRITVNTSLVTQLIEPLPVPSEFDLTGMPRCDAIPHAHFQADEADAFGLRGSCVYGIVNVTRQERFLCNYTVENPWVVFSAEDWCVSQNVALTPVNDFIDEATVQNGNVTFTNLTHTVFSDDLIYSVLPLEQIVVSVESDDVARVLVSESHLDVSEDGSVVAYYDLQLTTEPLYDVKIVVLPWLDRTDTKCYRFGLCNLTFPVDTYVFTSRDWKVPQRVEVRATDDDLDEYDTHDTGISHVSYSEDLKYHLLPDIPKIHVAVVDNDDSGFFVNRAFMNVTEGSAVDFYEVVLGSEPFAKVIVTIQNVGEKGSFAAATPRQLEFTWRDWNVPQTVEVAAVDDDTQDPQGSSSVLVHSLRTNDAIYAALRDLAKVVVWIDDNDVSGLELSLTAMNVTERAPPYQYSVRLTSEPWSPVVVVPNGDHDCYVRAATQERVCNVSVVTKTLYFGAGNWSQWQSVAFLAFDDSLEETPVHAAKITHSSSSKDALYAVSEYAEQRVALLIEDNDFSFVNISLAVVSNTNATTARSRLHVAEGGFNDSYSIRLNSEPYEDVVVTVAPRIERIISIDAAVKPVDAPQVGAARNNKSTLASGVLQLVFSALDWFVPREITVFGVDDEIAEDPTQFSAIAHSVESADAKYNISNASLGIVDVPVLVSDREAVPPPLPTSSFFDAAGTRLLVTFDSPVYHAATMLVRAASTGSAYAPRNASFPCALALASGVTSLGSGASCAWRLDLRQLRITLGVDATVVPGDVFVLHECKSFVSQVCQSDNVIRARHTSRAYTQAALAIRMDPAAAIMPQVVLGAPSQVGACGVWRVDATLTTGSAGRQYHEASWFVLPRTTMPSGSGLVSSIDAWFLKSKTLFGALEPLCLKYEKATTLIMADLSTELASFVDTLEQLRTACYLRSLSVAASAAKALKLSVNSTLIQADTSYVVGLALTNAFGQRGAAVQSVLVGQQPRPEVFAVGPTTLVVSRGEASLPVVVQADATLSCPLLAQGSQHQLVFRWFATVADTGGSATEMAIDLNTTNTAKDPRVFRVPRAQLLPGKTYRFRVDAWTQSAGSVAAAVASARGSTSFSVSVVSSPLVPVLGGGDRAIGEKDTLVLNASLTIDPDRESSAVVYGWRCEDWTSVNATVPGPRPCVNASSTTRAALALPVASPSAILTIEPFTLQPTRALRFHLTVSKTNAATKAVRSATTATSVWTENGSVPEVAIQPSTTRLNPSTRLVLNAVVTSTYPCTVRWLEDEGDLQLPQFGSSQTTHDAFSMPLTTPTNAILKDKLTPGQRYVLRLVATDINGNAGFGLVTFTVNAPPSPGSFQVSPREGYAMSDVFSLQSLQWADDAEDLPLQYAFGVLPTSVFDTLAFNATRIRQQMLPLVAGQSVPTAEVTMLPPEGLSESASMTVVALITDSMGSTTIARDQLTVRMPVAAKDQPVVFASHLLVGSESPLESALDASTKTRHLLSAALVMQRAMQSDASTSDKCPGSGGADGVCSGHGSCDASTFACVCDSGYMGPSCALKTTEVRGVNAVILSSLGSSAIQAAEPSPSGLGQQVRVVETVVQSTGTAFDASAIGKTTSVMRTIADNALVLQDSTDFLAASGEAVLGAVSAVLSIQSTLSESTPASARRLTTDDSTSTAGSEEAAGCTSERPEIQTSWNELQQTLRSLAAVASQDLLPGEVPVRLSSGQVATVAGAGSTIASGATRVNLTRVAVSCLTSTDGADLYMSVFEMAAMTHSTCSLHGASPISSSTIVSVHDRTSLSAALSGQRALQSLSLSGESACVRRAATSSQNAASTVRRLASDSSHATSSWQPLIALTIPHSRRMTSVEQRNFTTSCRAWNTKSGFWDSDVCFKDDAASSFTATVCYCSEISPQLEVLVALEERLDYYALSKELYRDEDPSNVGPVSVAILVGMFIVGSRVGQSVDKRDDQMDKEKTIKNLNRSKWSELQERVQAAAEGTLLEDFATYMAKREKAKEPIKLAQQEASGATAPASSESLLQTNVTLETLPPVDTIDIPNETRVLFNSSASLQRHFTTLMRLLRAANVVMLITGIVCVFIGLDFYLVLGNSASAELVLYLYGKPVGLVLLTVGGVLIILGVWGIMLSRHNNSDSSSRLARSSYGALLLVALFSQLMVVLLSYRYVHDLQELPLAGFEALRVVWNTLSLDTQTEIQSAYGCCGFMTISDAIDGCPEEALDASPPRTCLKVVEARAATLFKSSFVYLQAVFLAQVVAWILVRTLRAWRCLRLRQLAGESANSPSGETSSDRLLISSLLDVFLYCSLPSVLQVLVCLMLVVLLIGIDLLVGIHILTNEVIAGVLGSEAGSVLVAWASVYTVMLVQALHGIHTRDSRRLQWFNALAVVWLLASAGLLVFVQRVRDHWLLDPAIVDFIHAKYLRLTRESLVSIETQLECCGFDYPSEGSCTSVRAADDPTLPTCRPQVLRVLQQELSVYSTRLMAYLGFQAFVLFLSVVATIRLRRFSIKPQICPHDAARPEKPLAYSSFTHALAHRMSCVVVVFTGGSASVFGLVVICAGVDAMYQLNVLHLAYLLRVFDRHVAAYLLCFGGVTCVFGGLTLAVAWTRRRVLAWVFILCSATLFVSAFALAGFSYRFAYVPTNSEAFDERLRSFWTSTPPQTTRTFLQNAFGCCGYAKVERANGTVVYIDAAERSAWRFDNAIVEADVYRSLNDTSSQHSRRRLSISNHTPRRLAQVVCPVDATEACGPFLKAYVVRTASRAFHFTVALLVALCVVILAVVGLFWEPSKQFTSGRLRVSTIGARATLLLVSAASVFLALASFLLGLDIVCQWSLFSSPVLQLVFPRSIGVAFFIFTLLLVTLNMYTIQGVLGSVVHRVFLQSVGRAWLILCGWLCIGLTGYASHFGGGSWQSHLRSFLDRQWDTLTPQTQRRISLENQCCGFNDPTVVEGKGIVFDRPAVGFTCSLSAASGCRHALETQIGGSFGWLFVYSLSFTLVECLALVCSWVVLSHLRTTKPLEWFVIESRVRFAAAKYRGELRRKHLALSVATQFDRKLTRPQRLTSILCATLTTLAIYSARFAQHGCHRHALKTCQQPDAWGYLGMGLLYGGVVGYAAQVVACGLFEAVRNRSDDECPEVAVARQRKEKALLFRGVFSRKTAKPFSNLSIVDKAVQPSSLLEPPAYSTTEERWYTWLSRFTHSLYCAVAILLFLFGCGFATFMGLVLFGVRRSLYGVEFDQGPREALLYSVLLAGTTLLAWLAVDLKTRKKGVGSRSGAVFVAVALAAVVLLAGLCLGVFMASQALDEDSSNWTIRNTGFSVPQRLRSAWISDKSGFFRRRTQQELLCCGFKDGTDEAFRPCPPGTTVQVDYEAVRVDGNVLTKTKDEMRDLEGCYAKMMADFHSLVDMVAYVAAAVGVALLLLIMSALFLAHEVVNAKDAKLKLRVSTASATPAEVRETFEKVVGLKIAAPARGKILSKMLTASLENVAPHVVTELATESLGAVAAPTMQLPNGQVVSSSLSRNAWDDKSKLGVVPTVANVPYPAWVVRVVFAVCGGWAGAMGFVVATNSRALGTGTAWRCVGAWGIGVFFHLAVVEPFTVFLRILGTTLGQWWGATMVARLWRYGRDVLRVKPSAETLAQRHYASLSLYERIRFNAAVRIQRRLLTRLARRRFLENVRVNRELAHRALITKRRLTLKQAIDGFSAEEIDAFRLLFQDADTARLGLVSYAVISQSIYQLGVHVDAALVRNFLLELDPAYADLVDFEHFLYGMHRVRVHHQEVQAAVEAAKALAADEREAAKVSAVKEEFVSASTRFGPTADPQSRIFVKRQNLMRELREKRDSLSYKLMSKVGKLPPILQRSRTAVDGSELGSAAEDAAPPADEVPPTGAYVLLQNRKLSPKKRALEMMLKKKSREDKDRAKDEAPKKMAVPTLRISKTPRARSGRKSEDVSLPEAVACEVIPEGNEAEAQSPQKSAIGGGCAGVDERKPADVAASGVETAVVGEGEVSKQPRAQGDEGTAATTPKSKEDPVPFGTFMLLAKQAPNTGKSRVMEKILQKQSDAKATSAKAAAAEGDESDDEGAQSKAGEAEAPPRPTTSETRERASAAAKSSLEKALKKKAQTKPVKKR